MSAALLVRDLAAALDPVSLALRLGMDQDPWQAAALRSASKRLLFNIHRQGGKSTTAAVMALHEAVYRPGSLTLMVSPSLRQSGELYRKFSGFLHRLDPAPDLVEDNKLSSELANGSRVLSLPGSEDTIRGFSAATLIIEDEASRVDDALHEAITPMLATTDGRLVLMSTPWGKRGHFYDAWNLPDVWEQYRVPVTQNPRISPDYLERERRTKSALAWASEWECQFTDNELTVFGTEYVEAAIDPTLAPLPLDTSFWSTA